jgi:protein gp37
MAKTKIPWATHSINPIRVKGGGWHCTKVSAGCENCYSETMNMRFGNKMPYDNSSVEFELDLSCFDKLPKTKPAMVFVQSMGDLFHEDVPDKFIDKIPPIIQRCPQHKFLILTKRPERMYNHLKHIRMVMPNLWLGVSVEHPDYLWRAYKLQKIPCAVRFVSFEPLLADVEEISNILCDYENGVFIPAIDWCIVGGESGNKRRPCKTAWVWSIVNQCKDTGVLCFVKQIHINGKVSKNMAEWPEDLRVQEYPK